MKLEKSGGDIKASAVISLHGRGTGLDDIAGFPEPGALVHVLIEPLLTHGKPELLDEGGELGVEGPEGGEDGMEELEGHEVGGGGRALQLVEASREEAVEARDR